MSGNERIVEGTWKCPNCGNQVRGSEMKCAGCGQTRENVSFDYDASAATVDQAGLARAEGGADWVCGYCSTSNRSELTKCRQCGAGQGDGKARSTGWVGEAPPDPGAPRPAADPPGDSGMPWPIKLFLGGLAAVILTVFVLSRITHDETMKVASKSWSRDVQIESLEWVPHEAWEDEVPEGARELERKNEFFETKKVQSGTEKVKVGVKDMGNGYFKEIYEDRPTYREEKVYKDKVKYEVEEWKEKRKVSTSGDHTQEPTWGEVELEDGEREASRSESYTVELQGKKAYHHSTSQEAWAALELGKTYTVTVNAMGGITQVR